MYPFDACMCQGCFHQINQFCSMFYRSTDTMASIEPTRVRAYHDDLLKVENGVSANGLGILL